jgi:cation transport protein ChaC
MQLISLNRIQVQGTSAGRIAAAGGPIMALTDELVSLSLRMVADPGPDPARTPLPDEQVEGLADRLHSQSLGAPLWLFAYGSLIWKPDFDAVEWCRARARGWHRTFCLHMTRWRATEAQPGLIMALGRGGQCDGIAFRLSEEDRLGQIRRMIRREIGTLNDASSIRWIVVETQDGPLRVLVFWAGPTGERVRYRLPLPDVAAILARACGHMGSCAEYLYLTVKHLEERGIHDRNLWVLQELVASEIKRIHALDRSTGVREGGASPLAS